MTQLDELRKYEGAYFKSFAVRPTGTCLLGILIQTSTSGYNLSSSTLINLGIFASRGCLGSLGTSPILIQTTKNININIVPTSIFTHVGKELELLIAKIFNNSTRVENHILATSVMHKKTLKTNFSILIFQKY